MAEDGRGSTAAGRSHGKIHVQNWSWRFAPDRVVRRFDRGATAEEEEEERLAAGPAVKDPPFAAAQPPPVSPCMRRRARCDAADAARRICEPVGRERLKAAGAPAGWAHSVGNGLDFAGWPRELRPL